MRVIMRLTGATSMMLVLALGAAQGAPQRLNSGIRGMVTYGPTCPVVRPGRVCTRPYRAVIVIRNLPAGTIAARVRSAADGRFTVRLPAGRYRLEPRNGRPFPRARSQTVRVRGHRFTAVTIRYDSGIR